MINVVLCRDISVSVNLGCSVLLEVGRCFHRIAYGRRLLRLCCMASKEAINGLKPFYGWVDAVIHDAGLSWPRLGLRDGHGSGHLGEVEV